MGRYIDKYFLQQYTDTIVVYDETMDGDQRSVLGQERVYPFDLTGNYTVEMERLVGLINDHVDYDIYILQGTGCIPGLEEDLELYQSSVCFLL